MPTHDILGLGNAIVDLIAQASEDTLRAEGMIPGSMALIDAARAEALTARMKDGKAASGGSVANSCAVASGLGAKVAFLGKVADDALGEAFRADIAAAGVHYPTPPLAGEAPTARSLILVTPDGQRTMNTYLGACAAFDESDLDLELIGQSGILYLEGYLFDPPSAQRAFHQAALHARRAGRRVALSLSDAFCVSRHRSAFRALLAEIDLLFANEAELVSLYETGDVDAAALLARREVGLLALTRGAAGSTIYQGNDAITVAAAPARVVDTTGAGDCYAAGFLAGLARGDALDACGTLGSRAAAACIAQYGARPPAETLRRLRAAARM